MKKKHIKTEMCVHLFSKIRTIIVIIAKKSK